MSIPAPVYYARNTFFKLEYADDELLARNDTIRALNLQLLLKTRRESIIFRAGTRTKFVLRSDAVDAVGTHLVTSYSPAYYEGRLSFGFGEGASDGARTLGQPHIFPPEVALLHHYRRWDSEPKTDPDSVVDAHVPMQFGDALIRRISAIRDLLKKP